MMARMTALVALLVLLCGVSQIAAVSAQILENDNASPALQEIRYLQVVPRAQAGAVKWSQLAALKAVHPELRNLARATAEEQASLNNHLTTYLSNWYNITQIARPFEADCQTFCNLSNLAGSDFEIAYMNAMITHLDQIRVLSESIAASAVHTLLRQTALETAVSYTTKTSQLRQWLAEWYGLPCPA